jgi:hypothetical protein
MPALPPSFSGLCCDHHILKRFACKGGNGLWVAVLAALANATDFPYVFAKPSGRCNRKAR